MDQERYTYLMESDKGSLTPAEREAGWHWCAEFDGLLVGPGMSELAYCNCWSKCHPIYLTIPPQNDSETPNPTTIP